MSYPSNLENEVSNDLWPHHPTHDEFTRPWVESLPPTPRNDAYASQLARPLPLAFEHRPPIRPGALPSSLATVPPISQSERDFTAVPSPQASSPQKPDLSVWDRLQQTGKHWLQGLGVLPSPDPKSPDLSETQDPSRLALQHIREAKNNHLHAKKTYHRLVTESEALARSQQALQKQTNELASRPPLPERDRARHDQTRQELDHVNHQLAEVASARKAAYDHAQHSGTTVRNARATLATFAEKNSGFSPTMARAYVEAETGQDLPEPKNYRVHGNALPAADYLRLARAGDEILRSSHHAPESAAAELNKIGLSLDRIRGQVDAGQFSQEQGRELQERFYGLKPVHPGQYWPSEPGFQQWLIQNGKKAEYDRADAGVQDVAKVRELRHEYVNALAATYSPAIDFEWDKFEPVREQFVEDQVGNTSAATNFLGNAARTITSSAVGLASQGAARLVDTLADASQIPALVEYLTGSPRYRSLSEAERDLIAQRSSEWYRNAQRNRHQLIQSPEALNFNQALDQLQIALRDHRDDEQIQKIAQQLSQHAASLFKDESGLDTPDQYDVTQEPTLRDLARAYQQTRHPDFWKELRTRLATSVNGRKVKDALHAYITSNGERSPDTWKAGFLNARLASNQEFLSEILLTWLTAGALKSLKALKGTTARLAARNFPTAGAALHGMAAAERTGAALGRLWDKFGAFTGSQLSRPQRYWNQLLKTMKGGVRVGAENAAEEAIVAPGEEDLTTRDFLATLGSAAVTAPLGGLNRLPAQLLRSLRRRSASTAVGNTTGSTSGDSPAGAITSTQPSPLSTIADSDTAPTMPVPPHGLLSAADMQAEVDRHAAGLPPLPRPDAQSSLANPPLDPNALADRILPPKERTAYDLFTQGASLDEIAAATGLSRQGAFYATYMAQGKMARANATQEPGSHHELPIDFDAAKLHPDEQAQETAVDGGTGAQTDALSGRRQGIHAEVFRPHQQSPPASPRADGPLDRGVRPGLLLLHQIPAGGEIAGTARETLRGYDGGGIRLRARPKGGPGRERLPGREEGQSESQISPEELEKRKEALQQGWLKIRTHYANLADALGVEVVPYFDNDELTFVDHTPEGSTMIYVNEPELVSEALSDANHDVQAALRHLCDSMNEEVVHAAWARTEYPQWVKDEFNGQKAGVSFRTWIGQRGRTLTRDILSVRERARKAGDLDQVKEINQLIVASWRDYHHGDRAARDPVEILNLVSNDNPGVAFRFGMELLRQMVQLRKQKVTTGSAWRQLAGLLHKWLTNALVILKRAAKQAMKGKFGDVLPSLIKVTETRLNEARKIMRSDIITRPNK